MAITEEQLLTLVVGDKLIDTDNKPWLIIDVLRSGCYYKLICQNNQEIKIVRFILSGNKFPLEQLGDQMEITKVEKNQGDEPIPETLDYQQVLALAEDFMEKSGIRNFCTNTCSGRCCMGCSLGSVACHKNEGRRLPCSLFICSQIAEVLDSVSRQVLKKFQSLSESVNRRVSDCLGGNHVNVYFTVNDPKSMSSFRIPRAYVLYALPGQGTADLIKQQITTKPPDKERL